MAKKRTKSERVKEFYSTTEAAKAIGISDTLVSRYCKKGFQGQTVGQKVGRNYILTAEHVALIRDSERKVGRPKGDPAEG
jgi:predicted transcriptional regulator